MSLSKVWMVAISSSLLLASMPREARADGERGTRREESQFAQREAQAPGLAEFQGGGCMPEGFVWIMLATAPIWLAILPVYLIVKGVTWVFEKKDPPRLPPPEKAPDTKPAQPRTLPADRIGLILDLPALA